MKNLKKLVLIFTTNHVPELFSASESTVTYPGVEAGNSNSEHSIPHSSPRGEGRTGEEGGRVGIPAPSTLFLTLGLKGEGGGVGIPTPSILIPHPGVEGGRGRSVEIQIPSTLFLSLGFKGVG